MINFGRICAAGMLLLAATSLASAQEAKYPSDTIVGAVAFSAGGGTDTIARLISSELGKALGQSVVIENRPGAGGFVGWRSVAGSKPDGYSLLVSENAIVINPALRPEQKFDPNKELEPIAQIATAPLVLLVNKDVQANTVEELVALSQKDPTAVTFSSSGIGSVSHVAFEALARAIGLQATHIPYKGGGEAMTAIESGEVTATLNGVLISKAKIDAGNVKALVVTGEERASVLADVPSQKELNIDVGIDLVYWYAILGPHGISDEVKTTIQDAVKTVLDDPALLERMAKLGITPAFTDSDALRSRVETELKYWGDLIKKAGIKAE